MKIRLDPEMGGQTAQIQAPNASGEAQRLERGVHKGLQDQEGRARRACTNQGAQQASTFPIGHVIALD